MDQRTGFDRTPWVDASAAAETLGVKRETLYAYVSRGLVRSVSAAGGRARLYHRGDVERLRTRHRARAGHGAVAASALQWGDPVLETGVGDIRDDGPYYRGRSAVQLARDGATFEEVCGLLWGHAVPSEDPAAATRLGAPAGHLRALLRPRSTGVAGEGEVPGNLDPFDGMMVTAAALAAGGPRADPSIDVARSGAGLLVRRIAAGCALTVGPEAVSSALHARGAARALIGALGGRATAPAVSAVDQALVLAADHELNVSTFAARVTASSGASLAACVLAALASASGPAHGGESARVSALVAEVGRPERAPALVAARLERGESIPGFGHPLYAAGDPRGVLLLELAARVGSRARVVQVVTALVSSMALVARERPTIDVGLVALSAALGLRSGSPMAIFACGRMAGWIAHSLEQRAAGFLVRPRAVYVSRETGARVSPPDPGGTASLA